MKIPGLLLGTMLCASIAFAQQGIVVTGGDNSGTNGTVSFSVGQVDGTTIISTGGILLEGLQQPYEDWHTAIKESPTDHLLQVYPTPARDAVTLTVPFTDPGLLYYRLYDMQGRLVNAREISGSQTSISLNGYPASVFFLRVHNNSGIIKTFKLIKIQ